LVARQEVRLLQPRHIADLGQPLSALTVTRIEDALAPGHLDQYWRLTEERSRQTSLLLADVDIGTLNRPLTYAVDPGSVASTDNLGRALGEAFLHRSVCTLAPVPVAEMAPLFR
jgi:hypothetical protein